MNRCAFLLCAGILCGCEPSSSVYLYKPNTSVARADRDYFDCELAAAQRVPVNTQISTTPTYTTTAYTNCYGYGYSASCYTSGGQTYGGQTYSYDANTSLRNDFWARCMSDRGYVGVEFPRCSSETRELVGVDTLMATLKAPKENSCVVDVTSNIGNLIHMTETSESPFQ